MEQRTIEIGSFKIGNKLPLALLAGPCQIESRQHAIDMAGAMVEITKELGINYIFKASFDKANRTSINGARGVGLEEGMLTFEEIKKLYNNIPIVTDVHEKEQCGIVAQYVDMLQIPAFLCRQTDLVVAAAKTGKVVNIKKGQFCAPWDMKHIVKKAEDSGNANVCLTEWLRMVVLCIAGKILFTDAGIGCRYISFLIYIIIMPVGIGIFSSHRDTSSP